MKLRIAAGMIFFLMLAGALALAQSTEKDKDSDSKTARTMTGCLQKGDEANEFVLTAKDGSTWDLRSDSVDMAPHVGHEVTITGTASRAHEKAHEMKEGTKEEMHEHGMAKSDTEHGHLKVTNLKMVSKTCKQ